MYHAGAAMRYLCKFTREYTAFQGWRLALRRRGVSFVRYFSALELGGMQQAEAEARRVREALLRDLELAPDDVEGVFARYRRRRPELPGGLRAPLGGQTGELPRTCSLRFSREVAQLLDEAARRWGIDRASFLRAALYLLVAWSRSRGAGAAGVQPLVDFLAAQGEAAKLPPFSRLFSASGR